jgi:hypothetical protein
VEKMMISTVIYGDLKDDFFVILEKSAGRQYKTNKQKQWIHQ